MISSATVTVNFKVVATTKNYKVKGINFLNKSLTYYVYLPGGGRSIERYESRGATVTTIGRGRKKKFWDRIIYLCVRTVDYQAPIVRAYFWSSSIGILKSRTSSIHPKGCLS